MGIKTLVKKILPVGMKYSVANAFHFCEAFAANVVYGFPAKNMKVVMITGTNGKTTTAALVTQVLIDAGRKVGASTTAFYSFGDGLVVNDRNRTVDDIFKMQKMFKKMKAAGCEYIVLEVTSHALVQHRLWGVPCDVAVMTNLTQDHLDYHKTMEAYAAAKGMMFAKKPPYIVLNADDEWYEYFDKYSAREAKYCYGTSDAATYRIKSANLRKDSSDVVVEQDNGSEFDLHCQLPGKYNVYNAVAVALVGKCLGLEVHKVVQGISSLASVPGRLERVDEGQGFDVYVDYAHTPDAFENVLDTLRSISKKKLLIVFGATGDRDAIKRPIMGRIATELCDKIYLTDEETYSENGDQIRRDVMKGIEEAGGVEKTLEIADRREAIERALCDARKGDTVIITGMGHEQFRNMGGEFQPWNEVEITKELLEKVVKK